jgi:hypothetical protein
MGIAQDLLLQADHLATYQGNSPNQVSLRRAVSTAYYALFHLLIEDAALRWQGSSEAQMRIQRAFAHRSMKDISERFRGPTCRGWQGRPRQVPAALQQVAGTFVDLQEKRHTADYDNSEQWSATEVSALLNADRSAFQHWQSIRTDPIAGDYLLAMLLK